MYNRQGPFVPDPNTAQKYADIINLPRPEPSPRHPRMSMEKRAAQFRPVTMVDIPEPSPEEIHDYGDLGDWYSDQTTVGWCE